MFLQLKLLLPVGEEAGRCPLMTATTGAGFDLTVLRQNDVTPGKARGEERLLGCLMHVPVSVCAPLINVTPSYFPNISKFQKSIGIFALPLK